MTQQRNMLHLVFQFKPNSVNFACLVLPEVHNDNVTNNPFHATDLFWYPLIKEVLMLIHLQMEKSRLWKLHEEFVQKLMWKIQFN